MPRVPHFPGTRPPSVEVGRNTAESSGRVEGKAGVEGVIFAPRATVYPSAPGPFVPARPKSCSGRCFRTVSEEGGTSSGVTKLPANRPDAPRPAPGLGAHSLIEGVILAAAVGREFGDWKTLLEVGGRGAVAGRSRCSRRPGR